MPWTELTEELLLFPSKKAFPSPGNTRTSKYLKIYLLTWIWKIFAPLSTTGRGNQSLHGSQKMSAMLEWEEKSLPATRLDSQGLSPAFTSGRSHTCPYYKNKPNMPKLDLTVEIKRGCLCLPYRISVKGLPGRTQEAVSQHQAWPKLVKGTWVLFCVHFQLLDSKPWKPQLWLQREGTGISYL